MHRFYTRVLREGEHRGLTLQLRQDPETGVFAILVVHEGQPHSVSNVRSFWTCWYSFRVAIATWNRLMEDRDYPFVEVLGAEGDERQFWLRRRR